MTTKKERDRHFIEKYTKDQKEPVSVSPDIKETVYIGNCSDVTVIVETKSKGITLNNCTNVSVLIKNNVVGPVEVVNSKKCNVQTQGEVGIWQIDRSASTNVYLSEVAVEKNNPIFTAQSTATNIFMPKGDDMVELPVPEMFSSTIKDGELVTEVVTSKE